MLPPGPNPPTPAVKPAELDEATAKLLTTHLKGISSVTLRVVGKDPRSAAGIVHFLQGRSILVDVTLLEHIVPPPLRRFSFQYAGRSAVVTFSAEAPLSG